MHAKHLSVVGRRTPRYGTPWLLCSSSLLPLSLRSKKFIGIPHGCYYDHRHHFSSATSQSPDNCGPAMPEGLQVEPGLARLTHGAKYSLPSRDDHAISIAATTSFAAATQGPVPDRPGTEAWGSGLRAQGKEGHGSAALPHLSVGRFSRVWLGRPSEPRTVGPLGWYGV